ncbi:hypothetical protein CPLU01_11366 [Colletotrichum plurivorum]|uniref:Uncharacterized protein n=1 Tax=Colletotrichum plurivorum TaxID=2175906 RepID=A0A8H6K2Y6_9PEZI|nr:hypothetical protein CPLU01_11366 [Colletotrichum plurivorum]
MAFSQRPERAEKDKTIRPLVRRVSNVACIQEPRSNVGSFALFRLAPPSCFADWASLHIIIHPLAYKARIRIPSRGAIASKEAPVPGPGV